MTPRRRKFVGAPKLGAHVLLSERSAWIVTVGCLVGLYGCPVDDRGLVQRPGFVFLTAGGGGDIGSAGGGMAGDEGPQSGQGEAGDTTLVPATGGGGNGGISGSGGTSHAGQSEAGGSAGTSSTAIGGVSMGGAANGGAPGGSSGAGGRLIGRCPDLDDNFVFDCDETIVNNYAFDKDASDWTTETNLVLSWQPIDAEDRADSGSLAVEDTFTTDMDGTLMLGGRQCMPVNEQTNYEFAVEVSVPDGATGTSAGMQILVYNDDNCMGSMVDLASSMVSSGSTWSTVSFQHPTPKFAKSLVLRLVSIKPYREAPSNVLFDNVLVHPIAN
jgi:hypothetical protein